MKFQLLGPSDFEIFYARIENRLVEFLTSQHRYCTAITVLILETLFIYFCLFMSSHKLLDQGGFASIQLIRFGLILVLPFSLLFLFLSDFPRTLLNYILMVAMWVSTALSLFWFPGKLWLTGLCALTIPVIFASYWFFFQRRSKNRTLNLSKWTPTLGFASVFLGLTSLVSYFLFSEHRYGMIARFWGLKPQILVISLLVWSRRQSDSSTADKISNPLNGLIGVFWPHDLKRSEAIYSEKVKLWWAGILTMTQGTVLWGVYLLFFNPTLVSREFHNYTAARALLMLIGDVAFFNLLTGCAKILGYQVQPATNFLCLARTPAEAWRRGYVYSYLFSLQYIFVPLFRWSKSRFIATLLAFAVVYFNGEAGKHIFSALSARENPDEFYLDLLRFFANFLLIYVTSKYWFISKRRLNSPLFAWLSIFLTFSLKLLVFGLIRRFIAG